MFSLYELKWKQHSRLMSLCGFIATSNTFLIKPGNVMWRIIQILHFKEVFLILKGSLFYCNTICFLLRETISALNDHCFFWGLFFFGAI